MATLHVRRGYDLVLPMQWENDAGDPYNLDDYELHIDLTQPGEEPLEMVVGDGLTVDDAEAGQFTLRVPSTVIADWGRVVTLVFWTSTEDDLFPDETRDEFVYKLKLVIE